jgi:CrcB protein
LALDARRSTPRQRKLPGRPQEVVVGKLVLVCVGGAIGSGARYLVATWAATSFGTGFPRGTLIVNVAGSFLIAAIFEVSLRSAAISSTLRLFLTTGVMGGFTTYSSFNYETLRLFEDGTVGPAVLNLALTVLGCLGAGMLGLLSMGALLRTGVAGR